MKNKKKIAIYIPAWNVSHIITMVLDRIPKEIKQKVTEIIVIDNASEDSTYHTVIDYKHDKNMQNLKIIKLKENKGYGGSQKIAYQYCLDKRYDVVVMLHADAQYAPEYLPKIIKSVEEGNADLMFGSRISGHPLKGGMPLWRFIGNKTLTKLENLVLGLNLSEYHSGYRAYSCDGLRKVPFHLTSSNCCDTEMIVLFHLAGLRIAETTIPTHYGKESKHPTSKRLIIFILNILLTLWRYSLHKHGIKKYRLFEVEKLDKLPPI